MNAYDFDKTIYNGDSTLDFYKFCVIHHPIVITCLPKQIRAAILYYIKRIDKTEFKEEFYCFLRKLKNVDKDIIQFWNCHEKRIKTWYRNQQEEDDVIISASPDFLLKEICDRINVRYLIASQVDKKSGKYTGKNCYGYEKVRRLSETASGVKVNRFYSDSYSDSPMAEIAEHAFIVRKNQIMKW